MASHPPNQPTPDQNAPDGGPPPGDETERIEETRLVPTAPPARPRVAERPASRQRHQSRPRRTPVASAAPPANQTPPPAAYAPRRARAERPAPSASGWYLPWWSLVVMVAVVGCVALGLIVALSQFSAPNTPGNQPAEVRIVTSMPTLSQDFIDSANRAQAPLLPTSNPAAIPASNPTPTALLPTPIPSPSLPPGEFTIGTTVQVVGVGASGLNIRSSPGLDSTARFLAYDDDQFVLVEGPQSADDLEWWRIEDPEDSSRHGWAARNYLASASP